MIQIGRVNINNLSTLLIFSQSKIHDNTPDILNKQLETILVSIINIIITKIYYNLILSPTEESYMYRNYTNNYTKLHNYITHARTALNSINVLGVFNQLL